MSKSAASSPQKLISASLLRLRIKAPFFATLALFTHFIPTHRHPTAATDGKDIYYNPAFLQGLRRSEQDGLLLHEVLHAALLHPIRRGAREPKNWNIAADIVVNGIIAQQPGFTLPAGGIRDLDLENLSVEEVYELLLQQQEQQQCQQHQLTNPDLLHQPLESSDGCSGSRQTREQDATETPATTSDPQQESVGAAAPSPQQRPNPDQSQQQSDANAVFPQLATVKDHTDTGQLTVAHQASLEAHWQNALQQATLIARTNQQGHLPAGMERELEQVTGPQLDWRSHLWRYLVQTPTDFQGFDRRFVHQGLYLEMLQGESVHVYLCIDTSGSIDNTLLELFCSEVLGILSAYPHVTCELYYADAMLYGPYELTARDELPIPKGGGGTSFVPFFKQVCDRWDQITQGVCIYLTDGYGTFPEELPVLPVLWVVAPGGLGLEQFPFGKAVRLLSMA